MSAIWFVILTVALLLVAVFVIASDAARRRAVDRQRKTEAHALRLADHCASLEIQVMQHVRTENLLRQGLENALKDNWLRPAEQED